MVRINNDGFLKMTFKVTTRLKDIFISESFDTEVRALEQARSWARMGEVVIAHDDVEFSLEDFAALDENPP